MCILPRRLLPSCRKWACEIKWTPAAYAPPLWCRPTLPIPLQSAYPSPMKGFTLPTHNPSDVVPCWASLNYVGLHGAFTCVPPLLFRSMLRILLQCADLLQCPPLHLVPLAWPTTMLKLWLVFTKRPRINDIRRQLSSPKHSCQCIHTTPTKAYYTPFFWRETLSVPWNFTSPGWKKTTYIILSLMSKKMPEKSAQQQIGRHLSISN